MDPLETEEFQPSGDLHLVVLSRAEHSRVLFAVGRLCHRGQPVGRHRDETCSPGGWEVPELVWNGLILWNIFLNCGYSYIKPCYCYWKLFGFFWKKTWIYGRFYRIVYGIDVNKQLQLAMCSWARSGLWWIWIWMKPIWEAP